MSKMPARKKRQKKGLSLEQVIEKTPLSDQPDDLQVVHGFHPERGLRRRLGLRPFIYSMLALCCMSIGVILSFVTPWGLLGIEPPDDFLTYRSAVYTSRLPIQDLSLEVGSTVFHEPMITISGRIRRDRSMFVNETNIPLDENGWFEHELELTEGENLIELSVRWEDKRYDVQRITYYQSLSEAVSFPLPPVDEPKDKPAKEPVSEEERGLVFAPATDLLSLQVTVFPEATWLEVTADREAQPRINVSAGANQAWQAEESIVVSTGNASSTVLYLNGRDLGVMGDMPVEATRVLTWGDVR